MPYSRVCKYSPWAECHLLSSTKFYWHVVIPIHLPTDYTSVLQWQSCIVGTEAVWPKKAQIIYHLACQENVVTWKKGILKKKRNPPGGPVVQTPSSLCREPRFNPWSGNWIPHTTTESSPAATKDPACHDKNWRCVLHSATKTQSSQIK